MTTLPIIQQTLPPVSLELAPLLRCDAFLAYARAVGCEQDARFLLLATDYAIFYSAVKKQDLKDKNISLVEQLDTYATALRSTFFSEESAMLLSLLKQKAPSPRSFVGLAVTNSESRLIGLHAAAEVLRRTELQSEVEPSIFKPSFILVQSHLLSTTVPKFDAFAVCNITSKKYYVAVLCLAFVGVVVIMVLDHNKLYRLLMFVPLFVVALSYTALVSNYCAVKFAFALLTKKKGDSVNLPKFPNSNENTMTGSVNGTADACNDCLMLRTRVLCLRRAKLLSHVVSSILFALCTAMFCTFIIP